MLKLYTNTNFLNEEHRRYVFPLLFDLYFKKNKKLNQFYTLVDDISTSNIIVFPVSYEQFLKHKIEFLELTQLAKENQKPIWIYSSGDYGFTNYIKGSYTFRLGGFNSKMQASTFILPSFINDPYLKYIPQGFSELKKENKPKIGFVGHANKGLKKYTKELVNHYKFQIKRNLGKIIADHQPFYPSSIKRAKYLYKLKSNNKVTTNFILRKNYRAGVDTELQKQTTSQEFYDNINENLYTFCMRGIGNFSVRFYETLALGRIPILLDTDCRLPFSDTLDWHSHCIIVKDSKISIVEQVLNFHNSKSEKEIINIQKNNRLLWENYLTRESYFIKLYNIFKEYE